MKVEIKHLLQVIFLAGRMREFNKCEFSCRKQHWLISGGKNYDLKMI